MASGKSAVGRQLAELLDWAFVDMDREVERQAGLDVPEIFAREGEAGFRRREARAAQALLERHDVVVASGGGWPCVSGRMEGVPPGTRSVWLQVSAAEAVARVTRSAVVRPLLAVPDPEARARELLEAREPFYRLAHLVVDTDGATPAEVARKIARQLDMQDR